MRGTTAAINKNAHQTSDQSEFSFFDAQKIILEEVYHSVIAHVVRCTWSYLAMLWTQNEHAKYQAWIAHINHLLTTEARKPKSQQLFSLSAFPFNDNVSISDTAAPTVTLQLAAIHSLDLTTDREEKLLQEALSIEACLLTTLQRWLGCDADPYPTELNNKLQQTATSSPNTSTRSITIETHSTNTIPAIKLSIHFRDLASAFDPYKDPDNAEQCMNAKKSVVHFFTRVEQKKIKIHERPRAFLEILRLIHSIPKAFRN